MPNPKAGCIVPPNANLKPLYERLQKTIRLLAKKDPLIQTIVGNDESPEDDVIENIRFIYDNIIHHLPQERNNIRSIYLKYTMGKPVKIM